MELRVESVLYRQDTQNSDWDVHSGTGSVSRHGCDTHLVGVDSTRRLSGSQGASRDEQASSRVNAASCGVAACHEGHGPLLQG